MSKQRTAYDERLKKVDLFRQSIKATTGKMVTRSTAIDMLVDAQLASINLVDDMLVVQSTIQSRLLAVEQRLNELEGT